MPRPPLQPLCCVRCQKARATTPTHARRGHHLAARADTKHSLMEWQSHELMAHVMASDMSKSLQHLQDCAMTNLISEPCFSTVTYTKSCRAGGVTGWKSGAKMCASSRHAGSRGPTPGNAAAPSELLPAAAALALHPSRRAASSPGDDACTLLDAAAAEPRAGEPLQLSAAAAVYAPAPTGSAPHVKPCKIVKEFEIMAPDVVQH